MPSRSFAVNAFGSKMPLFTYNIIRVIKCLCFEPES